MTHTKDSKDLKEKKTERLTIRISEAQKRSIRIAAANRNMPIGQYLIQCVAWRLEQENF